MKKFFKGLYDATLLIILAPMMILLDRCQILLLFLPENKIFSFFISLTLLLIIFLGFVFGLTLLPLALIAGTQFAWRYSYGPQTAEKIP